MNPDCTRVLESLRHALREGRELDASLAEHVETCSACREQLAAAMGLVPPASVPPAPDSGPLEAAARKRFRSRQGLRVFGMALLLAALVPAGLAMGGICADRAALGLVALAAMFVMGSIALLLVRLPVRYGLYKRLGRGRQLSGVCLGLAQFTRTPVNVWRLAFVFLVLLYGAGWWLYVLMDLAMPVHPEDRAHLLRYRLARWWRGVRAA